MSLPAYAPMLAVPADRPFSRDGWLFEPKWDGVRAMLAGGREIRVTGRRGGDVTAGYPELAGCGLSVPVVLDGEIVVPGEDGRPSFERLQSRLHATGRAAAAAAIDAPVAFVVFDLLYRGEPLVGLPLATRRERLAALDLPAPLVVSESVEGDGLVLWEAVTARDLEGIMAKDLDAPYRPGVRSPEWRKIANVSFVRAVVGGFTTGQGGRRDSFGSLLVGQWEGSRLRFVGAVGTGFSDRDLRAIRAALDQASTSESPFHPDPALPADASWVVPALVASVGYRDWTSAGRLRHPRFRGFTDDPVEAVTSDAEGPA